MINSCMLVGTICCTLVRRSCVPAPDPDPGPDPGPDPDPDQACVPTA